MMLPCPADVQYLFTNSRSPRECIEEAEIHSSIPEALRARFPYLRILHNTCTYSFLLIQDKYTEITERTLERKLG